MKFKYKIGDLVYFDNNYNDVGYIEKREWLHKSKAGENQYRVYWFEDGEWSIMCEEDLNEVKA